LVAAVAAQVVVWGKIFLFQNRTQWGARWLGGAWLSSGRAIAIVIGRSADGMAGGFDGFDLGLRLGPANWRAGVGLGELSLPSTSRVQLREALCRGLGNVVDVGVDPGNRPTNRLRLVLSGLWFPDGLGAEESDLPTLREKLAGQLFHIGHPVLRAALVRPSHEEGALQHEVQAELCVLGKESLGSVG